MNHRLIFTIVFAILTMLISCDEPVGTDEIAPSVTITSPVTGTTVEGPVIVYTDASDDESVESVEFWINSVLVYTDNGSPWEYIWGTDSYAKGVQHSIQAKAIDPSGNIGESEFVYVTVLDPNTSPVATFTVDPTSGTTSTVFNFNAFGCNDVEDNTAQLQVRWDWENDGIWDTEYSTTKMIDHQFTTADSFTVAMEVKDSGEAVATFPLGIRVLEPLTVTDIDGNIYQTVQVGDQIWMAENLKVTHYRNNDSIQYVQSESFEPDVWDRLTTGAYGYYDDDQPHQDTYGNLYNWYAVADSRNIAPAGWHVPTDEEWQTLIDYLGGQNAAGGKLKDIGTSYWNSPNTGATNESGFTALPGGYRYHYNGNYHRIGVGAYFWSAAEYNSSHARHRHLRHDESYVPRSYAPKEFGFAIRCVRD